MIRTHFIVVIVMAFQCWLFLCKLLGYNGKERELDPVCLRRRLYWTHPHWINNGILVNLLYICRLCIHKRHRHIILRSLWKRKEENKRMEREADKHNRIISLSFSSPMNLSFVVSPHYITSLSLCMSVSSFFVSSLPSCVPKGLATTPKYQKE